jgi:hypothetical protein
MLCRHSAASRNGRRTKYFLKSTVKRRRSASRRRCVQTSRSAVQARLCSDALQALRRKEQKPKKVRPACVVCSASVTSLMLCRNSALRRRCVRTVWSAVQARLCSDASQALRRKEQKREVEEAEVRPDYVVCSASATIF